MSSQVARALYTASNSKVESRTTRKEAVTETRILTRVRKRGALRKGAPPRLAVQVYLLLAVLSVAHHRGSSASDLPHRFALAWRAGDCCLKLVTLTRPALLTLSGHRGTVPAWAPSLPCLPCFTLELGPAPLAGRLALAASWQPGWGRRGGRMGTGTGVGEEGCCRKQIALQVSEMPKSRIRRKPRKLIQIFKQGEATVQ